MLASIAKGLISPLFEILDMRTPGVGFAVERGEAIAHQNGYELIE